MNGMGEREHNDCQSGGHRNGSHEERFVQVQSQKGDIRHELVERFWTAQAGRAKTVQCMRTAMRYYTGCCRGGFVVCESSLSDGIKSDTGAVIRKYAKADMQGGCEVGGQTMPQDAWVASHACTGTRHFVQNNRLGDAAPPPASFTYGFARSCVESLSDDLAITHQWNLGTCDFTDIAKSVPLPSATIKYDVSLTKMEQTLNANTPHSQSPTPDLPSPSISGNASPSSAPSALSASSRLSDEGEHNTATMRDSSRPELTRSYSAGKGGCWTCRVRRKKCDEEREGDSCKTCLRLRIKCLGWGPKRPEWMRDKEKVAEYKASIKDQLSRAGLIRGQPRSVYLPHAASTVVPSQASAVAGPGPSTTSIRQRNSGGPSDFPYRQTYGGSPHFAQSTQMLPGLPGTPSASTDTMLPLLDTPNDAMFFTSPNVTVPSNTDTLSYEPLLSTNDFTPHTGMPSLLDHHSISPSASPSIPQASQEDYVLYYFQEVRKLQFVFAGSSLGNMLYNMFMSEPQGAVTNAICALASLHSARLRISRGLEAPNPHPERSVPKYFYDQAAYHLMSAKTINGQYSEKEAIAAICLVGFSTLSGGSTNWQTMLDIACEWLNNTGIHEDQNPKLALMNLSEQARFAAKATMWMDVMSSITLMRPPRYLALYRRLFGGGAGYWATTNEQFAVRMDFLAGCPDETVLALAETAALSHWKMTEQRQGTLSTRELIRRADQIENILRQRPLPQRLSPERTGSPEHLGMSLDPTLSLVGGMPAAPSAQGSTADSSSPSEEVRQAVAKIYRETAVLYLHTVISDPHPSVPEIANSINVLSGLLRSLPPSDFDRAIMFPICLAGSMSDDPLLRDYIQGRCAAHNDEYVGNLYQARTFMETVWHRRSAIMSMNQRSVAVDWRSILRDRWSNLLLA
ncbi:hypothetical protein K474DRAFT_1675932 [Panus rudis PR-1116 ss-1]|nr:hypothetical protein K474DRAFT_1675932 [Panus rudis PR-1116 ss-1]